MKSCHSLLIKMSHVSQTSGLQMARWVLTLSALLAIGVGIGCASGNVENFKTSGMLPFAWTHVVERYPNKLPAHGAQAGVRVIKLSDDGGFLMFEGFVNASDDRGLYTISEGDPISGFAGRWVECKSTIKVAYVKSYYWPDELKEFSEPIFAAVHSATIVRRGNALTFEDQEFSTSHSPTAENLAAIVPSIDKVWAENPSIRFQIDDRLTCESE
jgi:hypothetical protein